MALPVSKSPPFSGEQPTRSTSRSVADTHAAVIAQLSAQLANIQLPRSRAQTLSSASEGKEAPRIRAQTLSPAPPLKGVHQHPALMDPRICLNIHRYAVNTKLLPKGREYQELDLREILSQFRGIVSMQIEADIGQAVERTLGPSTLTRLKISPDRLEQILDALRALPMLLDEPI